MSAGSSATSWEAGDEEGLLPLSLAVVGVVRGSEEEKREVDDDEGGGGGCGGWKGPLERTWGTKILNNRATTRSGFITWTDKTCTTAQGIIDNHLANKLKMLVKW